MSRYLASRAVQTVVTLALMSFVVYLLIGLMPGDPIDMMIAGDPNMRSEDAARLRAVYGLDKPLLERYAAWAWQALQGNFGYSRTFSQPVLAVLWPRLINTFVLAGIAFVIAVAIALPLGIWAASRPRSRADYLINLFCFGGISTPPFWLALLLITLFAVKLGWLPAGGHGRHPAGHVLVRRPGRPAALSRPAGRHARAGAGRRLHPLHARRHDRGRCARTTSAPRAPRACPRAACAGATPSPMPWRRC